ncbi:MAG: cobalamin biosynthesis protein P47K, partial [Acidobacteria bacterium]|nr:cobalamin biosynthesis protein P47K [Acidobacteriota bacterium]
ELTASYPAARVLEISARTGTGIGDWIDGLLDGHGSGRVLDIDYDTYADGEALLGWLNCTVTLEGPPVDGDELLQAIAQRVHTDLAGSALEIAHLKLTLIPLNGRGISVVNAVHTDEPPETAFALDAHVDAAEITLNLRAEAAPERLEAVVRRALDDEGHARSTALRVRHLERFRPGRPTPTHRMAGVAT